ncbi:hypothetical protein A2291_06630 [candidate division WOR-1 bacterium RIFOXYB2_FULL_42_35]|uniref:Uncharacterized protein n=1 Tax=candidate division WOR-1 bacterium RIFOXYC2_FULL_41_25 TaxID=1802586 RepID=A0A1F4TPG3_UNCSA|nr:MAG: hypothetical protein A2291_06630 [candidate division WOR-1 bacterium RIFOXYB2_FULL_42_35]OGC24556.1 MAG: hypothetical protein A2247_06410 [candidate division WOR-1 bacterium RIFOXYA2_FULL_41_14]OGC34601.1 MAG: hypothetical protein A2462_04645 [candidate division WOR-1 bacterium RIFOXYC2_FULL_41_25]OGC43992.1 MAG: hypothetical protein A2548_06320 [candidate division WOR-1 bacterium RIFOXYD2_FULL_41_8]
MNAISGLGLESFNLYGIHAPALPEGLEAKFTDVLKKGLDKCEQVPGMKGVYCTNPQSLSSLNIVKVDPAA